MSVLSLAPGLPGFCAANALRKNWKFSDAGRMRINEMHRCRSRSRSTSTLSSLFLFFFHWFILITFTCLRLFLVLKRYRKEKGKSRCMPTYAVCTCTHIHKYPYPYPYPYPLNHILYLPSAQRSSKQLRSSSLFQWRCLRNERHGGGKRAFSLGPARLGLSLWLPCLFVAGGKRGSDGKIVLRS